MQPERPRPGNDLAELHQHELGDGDGVPPGVARGLSVQAPKVDCGCDNTNPEPDGNPPCPTRAIPARSRRPPRARGPGTTTGGDDCQGDCRHEPSSLQAAEHDEEAQQDEIPGELKGPESILPIDQAEPHESEHQRSDGSQPGVGPEQDQEEGEGGDEHGSAEPDQHRGVVPGRYAESEEDQVRDQHPIVVVLRPQHREGQVPVESSINEGDHTPVVGVEHVHGEVGDEDEVEERGEDDGGPEWPRRSRLRPSVRSWPDWSR